MKKKLKKWLIAGAALGAIAAIGVTLGFMFQRASITNTFVPAEVSCAVLEKLDGADVSEGSAVVGSEKSDIRVRNTGNVKEYLRVRLVSHFVDADGNVSGAEPSVYPKITLNNGWLAGEEHTYYYTEPIEPGALSPVMCSPFTLSEKETQDGKKLYQVVEVFAEAIQAEPADAVRKAWGVTVTDGTITG